MDYTNAQKLAAVVSDWARPAISQIASSKLSSLPFLTNLQSTVIGYGLVGQNYSIANELNPFIQNAINTIVCPILEAYFGKIPDDSIPTIVHSIVDTASMQPRFSILDGLVTFEQQDMIELKDLLNKNLPLTGSNEEKYQIIK